MKIEFSNVSFKRYNPYEYKKIVEDVKLRKESNYGLQGKEKREIVCG